MKTGGGSGSGGGSGVSNSGVNVGGGDIGGRNPNLNPIGPLGGSISGGDVFGPLNSGGAGGVGAGVGSTYSSAFSGPLNGHTGRVNGAVGGLPLPLGGLGMPSTLRDDDEHSLLARANEQKQAGNVSEAAALYDAANKARAANEQKGLLDMEGWLSEIIGPSSTESSQFGHRGGEFKAAQSPFAALPLGLHHYTPALPPPGLNSLNGGFKPNGPFSTSPSATASHPPPPLGAPSMAVSRPSQPVSLAPPPASLQQSQSQPPTQIEKSSSQSVHDQPVQQTAQPQVHVCS